MEMEVEMKKATRSNIMQQDQYGVHIMRRKNVLIFFFLLAVMTLATVQGQCENWKEFQEDENITWYYDKDSIHYPQQKKILGLMVRNKEIVNVWTREKLKVSGKIGNASLSTIYCATRQYVNEIHAEVNKILGIEGQEVYTPHGLETRFTIKPGSFYESLLKKVCP